MEEGRQTRIETIHKVSKACYGGEGAAEAGRPYHDVGTGVVRRRCFVGNLQRLVSGAEGSSADGARKEGEP